jgi:hypothetical protein
LDFSAIPGPVPVFKRGDVVRWYNGDELPRLRIVATSEKPKYIDYCRLFSPERHGDWCKFDTNDGELVHPTSLRLHKISSAAREHTNCSDVRLCSCRVDSPKADVRCFFGATALCCPWLLCGCYSEAAPKPLRQPLLPRALAFDATPEVKPEDGADHCEYIGCRHAPMWPLKHCNDHKDYIVCSVPDCFNVVESLRGRHCIEHEHAIHKRRISASTEENTKKRIRVLESDDEDEIIGGAGKLKPGDCVFFAPKPNPPYDKNYGLVEATFEDQVIIIVIGASQHDRLYLSTMEELVSAPLERLNGTRSCIRVCGCHEDFHHESCLLGFNATCSEWLVSGHKSVPGTP